MYTHTLTIHTIHHPTILIHIQPQHMLPNFLFFATVDTYSPINFNLLWFHSISTQLSYIDI